jgi:hypothetical protein
MRNPFSSVIHVPECKPDALLFPFFDQDTVDCAAIAYDIQLSTEGFIFTSEEKDF